MLNALWQHMFTIMLLNTDAINRVKIHMKAQCHAIPVSAFINKYITEGMPSVI